MVRKVSKKWLMRSGIFSTIIGATLVVGIACGGGSFDDTELRSDIADLQADVDRVIALIPTLIMMPGDGVTTPPTGPADPNPPRPHDPRIAPPTTALVATPAARGGDANGNGLERVIARGRVICGVQFNTPGFGTAQRVGHDADYCRAVAAAVFGVATTGEGGTLEFVNATGSNRFELLQQGDIDLLVRTTTWTSGRDSGLGAQFTATTFYDNAGIMVSPTLAARISGPADLDGARLCTLSGTSTLDAVQDLAEELNITIEQVTGESADGLLQQYRSGACDAYASDRSQLAGFRSQLTGDLRNSVILSDAQLGGLELAKEPLGPSVHADAGPEWFDLVQWVNFGLIAAEEEGITQSNVATFAARNDLTPNQQRILGVGDGGDNGFTFNDHVVGGQAWLQNVIRAVGNFGEVYDANLGSGGIGLDRACTAQALWLTSEENARGSAVWQDCDRNGVISQEENRGLIYVPRYSG